MDVLYMMKFVLKIKNPVEGENKFKKKKNLLKLSFGIRVSCSRIPFLLF